MIAVLSLDATPAMLGVLAGLSYGPAVIVGFIGGGFVDRRRRRPIMIAADLIRAAILITIPIGAWLGLVTLPLIFVAAAVVGATSVLFDIADHALLPSLLTPEQLVDGNAKLATTESIAEMGGPALAGFLFQWLAAPFALAINAATYLVSAGFLATIGTAEPLLVPAPPEPWIRDITQGFRIAWTDLRVRPLLLMAAFQGLFGGIFAALYVLFALKTLGLSPAMLGLTIGFGGLGALAGSFLAAPLSRRLGMGRAILAMGFAMPLISLLIPLAPAAPWVGVVVLIASQVLGDAAGVAYNVLASSFRQTRLPPAMLGRVAGAFQAASGGTLLIGAVSGGLIGGVIGVRQALFVAAIGLAFGPIVALFSPLTRASSD